MQLQTVSPLLQVPSPQKGSGGGVPQSRVQPKSPSGPSQVPSPQQ
jgi:hypothetical protein